MSELESNAGYWREKADEARAIADTLQSDEARQHMRAAAASYDRLAELAEDRQAKTTKVANEC